MTATPPSFPYRTADPHVILDHLGGWASATLGLRELVYLGYGIQGRIGIGSPAYKLLIRLLASDLYEVSILCQRGDDTSTDYGTQYEHEGVEAHQLAEVVLMGWAEVVGNKR